MNTMTGGDYLGRIALDRRRQTMDTTTLVIILVVLIVLGGGWYGRGRWY
jgi:hypothetical protein